MILAHSENVLIQKIKNLTFSINMATEEIKEYLKNADHPTTHYIWRTQGDGKVRSRHAKFNGKIFSWDNPPAGGYHPGEDYGCRCIAEPYKPKLSIKEHAQQTLTDYAPDASYVWTVADYFNHYYNENGKPIKLHQIGILKKIIDRAKTTVYPKVERLIFKKVQQERVGIYPFRWNDSYSFHLAEPMIGGATVTLNAILNVQDMGYSWKIEGTLNYDFYDKFTDPLDLLNNFDGEYDLSGSTPFDITDKWSTKLEAVILKTSAI